MTKKEIDSFEKTQAQLEGLYTEINSLSKKSQDDAVNKFKLKFVNQILSEANAVLKTKYKPFSDFDNFDESAMPTNSDVALILTQYLSCFEKLRADNVAQYNGKWYWVIDGERTQIRTVIPKIIKER